MPPLRRVAFGTLAILAAISIYAFFHERLLAQPLWTPNGQSRFVAFSAVYWAIAAVLLLLRVRWFGLLAASLITAYAIWWAGPAAPLATFYFFASCFCTGKILRRDADPATAILSGLAAWTFAIWIAVRFPVNTAAVYGIALAIPYLVTGRELIEALQAFVAKARAKATFEWALVGYFLFAYFLITLKPETSADAVSMHLALPMAVAHDHRWGFDFRQYTWAMIPAGGDLVFTTAYLLGGETAARLSNFGVLIVIAAMIAGTTRRPIAAALFLSTPLAFLVTGSLFVENLWAAFVLGAVLALIRYLDHAKPAELRTAGVLFGAALAVKTIAALFLAPAAAFAVVQVFRRKQFGVLLSATVLLAAFAAPPYLYAWIKAGNPLFPFANTVFRSPYYDSSVAFSDPRFAARISWRTPYDVTFRSSRYIEGQGGAGGFQYFLLLLPAAILVRRREAAVPLAIGAVATAALFIYLPNLRYAYAALPLFSITLGCVAAEPVFPVLLVLIAAVNAWFLAASGWYQKEFALFYKSEIPHFLEAAAPERILISRLNTVAPGEPVAFFSTGATAGLNARAYTDSWHSYDFSMRVSRCRTAEEVAGVLRQYGIRQIVAPLSRESAFPLIETFLRQWLEPSAIVGRMAVFTLLDQPVSNPRDTAPLPPGAYDDLDPRIEYTGAWNHDRQFAEAGNSSITYSDVPDASIRLKFEGSGIVYVFTKALNRGTAQVLIDGNERARIDMYSARTQWGSQQSFERLAPGEHTFEVRVLSEKNVRSADTYVDLDAIVVKP